jgi:transposase
MGQNKSDEFKQDAVRIALTSGLTRRQVSSDLGVGLSTLNKWIKQIGIAETGSHVDADLLLENERLRRENRILREEREVLKKATAFFARQKT